jgi:hypothetical protein
MTNGELNHRTIITASCAHEDGIYADVIIRADGTNARWDPKYGPHQSQVNKKPTPMILVDLHGDRGTRSQANAEARVQDYGSHGWITRRAPLPPTEDKVRERESQ